MIEIDDAALSSGAREALLILAELFAGSRMDKQSLINLRLMVTARNEGASGLRLRTEILPRGGEGTKPEIHFEFTATHSELRWRSAS